LLELFLFALYQVSTTKSVANQSVAVAIRWHSLNAVNISR